MLIDKWYRSLKAMQGRNTFHAMTMLKMVFYDRQNVSRYIQYIVYFLVYVFTHILMLFCIIFKFFFFIFSFYYDQNAKCINRQRRAFQTYLNDFVSKHQQPIHGGHIFTPLSPQKNKLRIFSDQTNTDFFFNRFLRNWSRLWFEWCNFYHGSIKGLKYRLYQFIVPLILWQDFNWVVYDWYNANCVILQAKLPLVWKLSQSWANTPIHFSLRFAQMQSGCGDACENDKILACTCFNSWDDRFDPKFGKYTKGTLFFLQMSFLAFFFF